MMNENLAPLLDKINLQLRARLEAVLKNEKATILNLNKIGINQSDISSLKEIIVPLPHLNQLIIKGNEIDSTTLSSLIEIIGQMPGLRTLFIENKNLKKEDAKKLSSIIKAHSTLSTFYFHAPMLSGEEILSLIQAVKVNEKIKQFSLECFQIMDKEALITILDLIKLNRLTAFLLRLGKSINPHSLQLGSMHDDFLTLLIDAVSISNLEIFHFKFHDPNATDLSILKKLASNQYLTEIYFYNSALEAVNWEEQQKILDAIAERNGQKTSTVVVAADKIVHNTLPNDSIIQTELPPFQKLGSNIQEEAESANAKQLSIMPEKTALEPREKKHERNIQEKQVMITAKTKEREALLQGGRSFLTKAESLFPEEYKKALKELDDVYKDKNQLPPKIGLTDEENSQYDANRLNYIIKAINFLLNYYAPNRSPITALLDQNERAFYEGIKLLNCRRLLEHMAFTIFHVSGALRSKYKNLLKPTPFTWETFEQLGGLMKIAPKATTLSILLTNVSGEVAKRLSDEYLNIELIVEAAIPTILQYDIPQLKDLFIYIQQCENQPHSSQQHTIAPVSLTAIKALTRRVVDTENLVDLLKNADNHCTELVNQDLLAHIEDKIEDNQLYSVELEKDDKRFTRQYNFDTKLGQHAALRRLEKIGELVTGKNFSAFLKELNPSIDWQALVAIRDTIAHQDEKDNKAKIEALLKDENLFRKILHDEMNELFIALTKIVDMRDEKLPKFTLENVDNFWQAVFDYEKKVQADITDQAQKTQAALVQPRATKEDTEFFINSLKNAHTPQVDQIQWLMLLNGRQPIPNKKEYGQLVAKIPKDNKELYKQLKSIAEQALYPRSDLASREQARQREQALAKQREEEQERIYIGLINLRAFAKSLDPKHFNGHGLTRKQRVGAAIEALENIKQFMEQDPLICANFNYSSLKAWEKTQNKESAINLFVSVLENSEFNDAIEYNAAQLLQHLDTIRNYSEARGYRFLDGSYDDLRYLRNYIEHGNYLFDKEEYDPGREKSILTFRKQRIAPIMITLIFELLPRLKSLEKNINAKMPSSKGNQDETNASKAEIANNQTARQFELAEYISCLSDYEYLLKHQQKLKSHLNLQLTDFQILEQYKNSANTPTDNKLQELYAATQNLMLTYQRLLAYQYVQVPADTMKLSPEPKEYFAIINNQKFVFEERQADGDGWCALNAAGIPNPEQAVLALKNHLNNPEVNRYLFQAILNNLYATSLGEEFAIGSNDDDGNDISTVILSLYNELHQHASGSPNHIQALAQLTTYLNRPEVLSAYIDYLKNNSYVDENVAAACLSLQGWHLAAFHDYLGTGELTSNVADGINLATGNNIVYLIVHPGTGQTTAHYNTLRLIRVEPITVNNPQQGVRTTATKSLKEKIFHHFNLDTMRDEKLELERGLRNAAAHNKLAYLPDFFSPELGIHIDINAVGSLTGKTALHFAVEKGNKRMVSELLERGAKYDIPDKEGKTALQLAQDKKEIAALFPKKMREPTKLSLQL